MIAVISYSKYEFNDFIRSVHIDDRKIFRHVRDFEDVHGVKFTNVIKIGDYKRMPDFKALYFYALSRII